MLQDDKALEAIRQLVKEVRQSNILAEGAVTKQTILENINNKELAEKQELKEYITRNIVNFIKESGD
jgi:hypothetical protein